MRPRLLDLFCGAGGATKGYQRAGFYVVGVDIEPQPNYCGDEFIQADALDFLAQYTWVWEMGFDAFHASPPCQAYSVLRRANPGTEYPDLIEPVRVEFLTYGKPYVIENVPGAPLRDPLVLCGSMFDLGADSGDPPRIPWQYRQLRRHRLFESNLDLRPPRECSHRGEALGVYGGGRVARYTYNNGAKKDRYGRRGGYQGTVAERRAAMGGVDWMTGPELNQSIPPAYTEHIGRQLIAALEHREAA